MSGETEQQVSGWTVDTSKLALEAEISHVQKLLQQAHEERDKALEIQYTEFLRRLDDLNHAHQQAREKERDFISREAFETFVTRTSDDFASLRAEIRQTADAAAAALKASAETLASNVVEQNKSNEIRFGRIENALTVVATKHDVSLASDRFEALVKPLAEFVLSQRGRSEGIEWTTAKVFALFGALGVFGALYFNSYGQQKSIPAAPTPIVVTVKTPTP